MPKQCLHYRVLAGCRVIRCGSRAVGRGTFSNHLRPLFPGSFLRESLSVILRGLGYDTSSQGECDVAAMPVHVYINCGSIGGCTGGSTSGCTGGCTGCLLNVPLQFLCARCVSHILFCKFCFAPFCLEMFQCKIGFEKIALTILLYKNCTHNLHTKLTHGTDNYNTHI